MRQLLLTLLVATQCLLGWTATSADNSADRLFIKSDITGAMRESAAELRRNPRDVNAHFVHMEAARLRLRSAEELASALGVLQNSVGEDSRGHLAAERIHELAANTPAFRCAIPHIAVLLRRRSPFARELSTALLTAAADGLRLPRQVHLLHRVTKWQVAGPFGRFPNIDFDHPWAPEEDELRSEQYDGRIREDFHSTSGELELPDYFTQSGVYYAAAPLHIARSRKYRLTIESDGTFVLQLDGKDLLQHDARFRQPSAISHAEFQMATGEHRLLLKFQKSALPLRVWIDSTREISSGPLSVPKAEQDYLNAAIALLEGDVKPGLLMDDGASIVQVLKAEALSQIGDEQEARESLLRASESDSNNSLAAFLAAEKAFGYEQYEQAAAQLGRVLKVSPAFAPAQELRFQLAAHFAWRTEQEESLQQRLRLHPSCSALIDAVKFFESGGKQEQAELYEARLAHCSLKPYQYWEQLSQRGKHQRVITTIDRYLQQDSHDRQSLVVAIREAVLANQLSIAKRYAQRLQAVAPNSSLAALLIGHPASILDSPSASGAATDFYKPYVRDPLPMMADRPAHLPASRVLVNDRVIKLDSAGAWVYQHTVTQAFDKKGIALAAEIELPRSADVLDLRTIKSDGQVVEPELGDAKGTVSMPSFAEGDAVELAWLQHFSSELLAASPEVLDFIFASMLSPTTSANLTVIRERVPEPLFWHSPELKTVYAEKRGEAEITTWQIIDMPAPPEEPGSPQYEKQPRILWLSMDKTAPTDAVMRLREELMEATRITPWIEDLATHIRSSTEEERVSEAYRLVTSTIENEAQSWSGGNITSADESFHNNEGSRAAALIALLSAMGVEADLELAAERGKHPPQSTCTHLRCYTHPLVRVKLSNSKILHLEPQIEGLATGALSPEVEGEQALILSRLDPNVQTVSVPVSTNQRSTATANLRLDESGSIFGTINIQFGSLRSAQMRTTLRKLSSKDRSEYFDEIAGRILPNASEISAIVMHEDDPEQPLELELQVKATKFTRWIGPELQLGQIVPALGLSRLYATLPQRRDAVVIETPLVESSEFIVHLPPGVESLRLPEMVELKSSFGEYRAEFNNDRDRLRIVRSFRIPMQEISAADYPAFSRFAFQIDSAERELIQLHRSPLAQVPMTRASSPQMPTLH